MNAWTIFAVVGTVVYYYSLRRRSSRSTPPGPPSVPLLGNIWSLRPKAAWYELTRLKEKYGELIYYHGLGNTILVLNSMEAVNDLLEKKSQIYANRPKFTVVGELMGLDQSMPMLPYGTEWRAQRKLAHLAMNPSAVVKYRHIQEELAILLMNDILEKPKDFFTHIRLAAGRIVLVVAYGLKVKNADDSYIADAEKVLAIIGAATVPGAFLADFIPFLKHIKWLQFHKEAAAGFQMVADFVTKPLQHVQNEMASGDAPSSLARDLLEQPSEDTERHLHRVKWSVGALYGAGAETTYTTALVFVLAMAMYPEVQLKAQAEVDRVVPPGRLPTVADRPHLQYLEAVIKETLRWHPALPLGLARASAEDDVYKGYFIPKGTIIMPNVWAIAFAPNDKYDPQQFIPERFLDPEQVIVDPMSYSFGFGRRICPGKALADTSVFLILAHLLSVFDILPPEGGVVPPKFGQNLISYPEPFDCVLVPRSEEKRRLVQNAALDCTI